MRLVLISLFLCLAIFGYIIWRKRKAGREEYYLDLVKQHITKRYESDPVTFGFLMINYPEYFEEKQFILEVARLSEKLDNSEITNVDFEKQFNSLISKIDISDGFRR